LEAPAFTARISKAPTSPTPPDAELVDAIAIEGISLHRTEGLTQEQIDAAFGDAKTRLPKGLSRPAHWNGGAAAPAA
jgi:hypothetical protein